TTSPERGRERHGLVVVDRREGCEGLEDVPGLRDGPDGSFTAAGVDALDAILPVGPEHHRPAAGDHGQAVEPSPEILGVRDGGDARIVCREDPAHPRRAVSAEGNSAGLVHRGTQRADGLEWTTSVRHSFQAPVTEKEDALAAAAPETAVEAHGPLLVQVRAARDTAQER